MNDQNILDLYEMSDNSIASEIGRRFRNYRIALRMTQQEVAKQSGVSVMTIVRFEKGKGSSVRLDTFLSFMRAIQRLESIAEVIPEMQESLYEQRRSSKGSAQRVRRRKDER